MIKFESKLVKNGAFNFLIDNNNQLVIGMDKEYL